MIGILDFVIIDKALILMPWRFESQGAVCFKNSGVVICILKKKGLY